MLPTPLWCCCNRSSTSPSGTNLNAFVPPFVPLATHPVVPVCTTLYRRQPYVYWLTSRWYRTVQSGTSQKAHNGTLVQPPIGGYLYHLPRFIWEPVGNHPAQPCTTGQDMRQSAMRLHLPVGITPRGCDKCPACNSHNSEVGLWPRQNEHRHYCLDCAYAWTTRTSLPTK